ncbi:MAG: hypothetical protein J07HX64_01375 [halophilic archaeon J07HX64]|nr:MAG: hypothetical protein J07HX64_01375 [halophilic archaeon J07HX64]
MQSGDRATAVDGPLAVGRRVGAVSEQPDVVEGVEELPRERRLVAVE